MLDVPKLEVVRSMNDADLDALFAEVLSRRPMPPIAGGDRQLLTGGPYIDPPVTAPLSANTATTATDLWSGAQYTPIFANDPKAGKIYIVEAGGVMAFAATGTLTISPFYGTSSGVALGASPAQPVPGTITSSQPWYLRFVLVFRVIGAAGANSTVTSAGTFVTNGDTAADSSFSLAIGSSSASVDATVTKDVTVQKTLTVAGSFTTNFAFIYSLN